MIPANMSLFSPKQDISDRKTERLRITIFPAPHLANAFVWNLCAIRLHDNYRWNEEWQGSEPDVFITVVSDHRRHGCGVSAEARGETWQYINLSVWRSTEVRRFLDPLTHRSDLTTLSIACAHDKGTADRWKEKIKEQAALVMTSKLDFLELLHGLFESLCVYDI